MKIAVFINYLYPELKGGVSKYVWDIARHYAANGNEVEVFTGTKVQSEEGSSVRDGFRHTRCFLKNGDLSILRRSNLKKYRKMFSSRLDDFDVLNIQGIGFVGLKEIRKYAPRILLTCHASLVKELWFDLKYSLRHCLSRPWRIAVALVKIAAIRYTEKQTLTLVNRIVVMSRYVKNYVMEMYPGIAGDRIIPIPIGIDNKPRATETGRHEAREHLKIGPEVSVFFTLRRLVPRMGLENLLHAVQKVVFQNSGSVLFIIGGGGPLLTRLTEIVTTLGVERQVRLAGYIPEQELVWYYHSADAFILPTEALEGFGIVTVEALSYNLPVIGTNTGATPEILRHFQPDLICEGTNPEVLADKILYFLQHYRGKHLCNREITEQRYSWEAIMPEYDRVLHEFGTENS